MTSNRPPATTRRTDPSQAGDTGATGTAGALRRLYFARFAFAAVWAGLLALTADDLGLAAAALLVLYPLVDVAAAVIDVKESKARELRLNIAISVLAALGLAAAATSGIPAALRIWGARAILAGVVQLVVALRRRELGGQWAMIASGGISTLAGASFIVTAEKDDPTLFGLAGYAVLGGVFFLISSIRLGRGGR